MATASPNITPHMHVHAYETSSALAKLCAHLYGYSQAQFEAFCQRSHSRIQTPIWAIPSKNDLAKEPDFVLRQFLWFIRPPETLEFVDLIAPLWPILESNCSSKNTSEYPQYLPVAQLKQTWQTICEVIKSHPDDFPKLKTPKPGEVAHKNLMVDHRSASYPLFTALVNFPDLQKVGSKLLHAHYQKLQAYFLIREAFLLKQQKDDGKDGSYHPYLFLQASTTQSGLSKIAYVSRLLRRWGEDLNASVIGTSLNDALSQNTFDQFIDALEKKRPPGVDDQFVDYFAQERGFRKSSSPTSPHRGSRGQSAQGGMDWPELT